MARPPRTEITPGGKFSEPGALLSWTVTRIGQVVGLLAGIALIAIIVDQTRHLVSDTYTADQRMKHGFMCYRHSRKVAVADASDDLERRSARIEENVYQLMDVVRQQNAPIDFLGKLRHFALCSSFSKAGFGGFEVSGARDDGQSTVRIGDTDIQLMLSDLDRLAEHYPDFPTSSGERLECELRRLQLVATQPDAECTDGPTPTMPEPEMAAIVTTPADLPACPLTATRACRPNPDGSACACLAGPAAVTISEPDADWLLVVGADQSDAAAVDQVRKTRRMLEQVTTGETEIPRVELRLLRSWRRTVVVFDSEAAARAALGSLGPVLQYGAYLRQQSSWCPDLQEAAPIDGVTTKICELSRK